MMENFQNYKYNFLIMISMISRWLISLIMVTRQVYNNNKNYCHYVTPESYLEAIIND